jgi:hypothetical protein
VIAGACHRFTIHGRDPAYDVTLGGDAVHFATAGEAVTIYDAKTRSYRPSTLLDLYDTARLVDRLDNIHRFCQTVIATEIEDPRVHAINIAYALVAGTQKSLAVSILGPDDIAAVIAMFRRGRVPQEALLHHRVLPDPLAPALWRGGRGGGHRHLAPRRALRLRRGAPGRRHRPGGAGRHPGPGDRRDPGDRHSH